MDEEERAVVELRVHLSRGIRQRREALHLTQQQLAKKLKSSQSRVAKLEAAAPGVSLDLLLRNYYAVGGRVLVSGAEAKARGDTKLRRRPGRAGRPR